MATSDLLVGSGHSAQAIRKTVFCVIPVHNRLSRLKSCIDYLNVQDYRPMCIVIIDDGSTDGTFEYLATIAQANLTVLRGDGNLWWGGAMRLGMAYVLDRAETSDYLLMLNDDVKIDTGYVSSLVGESLQHQGAIVGSVQCCQTSGAIMSCGFSINYFTMNIIPVGYEDIDRGIDALPGRGILYPISVVRHIGLVNSALFPHYLGDIEYSARARDKGYLLTVSRAANIYTERISSDQHIRTKSHFARWFSFRSKGNVIHRLFFFSVRGPIALRLCVIPRFLGMAVYHAVARLLSTWTLKGDDHE